LVRIFASLKGFWEGWLSKGFKFLFIPKLLKGGLKIKVDFGRVKRA